MSKSEKFFQISRQRGFLAILAVFLVVVVGFFAVAASYMFVSNAVSGGDMQQSENAFYTAESGLEITTRAVRSSLITGTNKRITCAAVSGTAALTNAAAAGGTFTASTLNSSPIYVNSKLNGALTATATTIPITSTTGFSPSGMALIDHEQISYGDITGNSLNGVTRGYQNSPAAAHATAAAISQYQCNLSVTAGVPTLAAPIAKRTLVEDVPQQEAWVVGAITGATFTFTRWNRPTEVAWTLSNVSAGTAEALNDISMLSHAEGWAVGAMNGTAFRILHWTGSAWAAATTPTATCNTQILNGVSAVSSIETWAVGARYFTTTCSKGNYSYTVLRWNGTTWTALSNATSPSIPAASTTAANMNSVQVISTVAGTTGNFGFAVGDGGVILEYNGTKWATVTSPTTQNLESVFVVSANESWAVGTAGVILKWNGTAWASVTSPTSTQLNSIAMVDATGAGTAQGGWAVGNSGVAVKYNGSSWSSLNTGSSNNMNSVATFLNVNDVWAAGAAGTLMHYDGTAWTSIASGTAMALNSISTIAQQPYTTSWQETFA
jgi:Tfp pilus assembly protein PilX